MEPLTLVLLVVGGLVAGVVNTLAGGGSYLTLPILLGAGFTAQVASATSRLPIVFQCAAAMATFSRGEVRTARPAARYTVAGVAGAIGGAFALELLPELLFRRVLAALLVASIVPIFLRRPAVDPTREPRGPTPLSLLLFVGIGFYVGFVQAGVGFLVLAALTGAAGYDLVRANAIKVTVILGCTLVALVVFFARGIVDLPATIALSVGQLVGGWIGAKLAIRQGARFVRAFVVVTAFVSVVMLLFPRG